MPGFRGLEGLAAKWGRGASRLPLLSALLVFVLGAIGSTVGGRLDAQRQVLNERNQVLMELAAVRARVEGIIEGTFNSTDGIVHLISLRSGIDESLFSEMARLALSRNPPVRNITVAPNDRVQMVYPLAGNEKVLGFQFSDRPEQYRMVVQARERRTAVLSGPVQLVQGGRALVQRMPVFVTDPSGASEYWGTVSIVAGVDELLKPAWAEVAGKAQVAIRGKDALGAEGDMVDGDPALFEAQPLLMDVRVPGGTWQLAAAPQGGWHQSGFYHSLYFQFGLAISVLLAVIAGLRTSYARQLRGRNRELEREIAERQRAVEAQHEEEERFRALFDSSPEAVWIIEQDGFVQWNPTAARLFGVEMAGDAKLHPASCSPEFQPDGQLSLVKAREMTEIAARNGWHRFEWIHLRGDKTPFFAEVTLIAYSSRGKSGIYGVVRDISEKKQDEERLKLAAAVLASTAEGVLITDVKARIVAVNRAFTEITGFSEAEALGQKPAMLRSEHQGVEFYQEMWKCLAETDVWCGEIWNRRKNGEVYPEWLVISAIRDEQNEITHYVGVFSDISSLKHSQARLEHLAHFDSLTDLPNRILFQDRLAHEIDRAARQEEQVAVLVLDLDGFKTVNDSLGHPVGDQLLSQVAERLQCCVRQEDTVARLGGDEFAIILGSLNEGEDAVEVVRKILASIEQPFDLAGVGALISTSVGVAVYPLDGQTATELVRNADAAMYGAKEGGRNTYRFYQASMTQHAQERLHREAALRRGIERKEFEVWFQPQISLHTGRLTGAEALVRWRDPERGLVSPIEFIPLAERTGLILPLGELVLMQVCQWARRWLDEGLVFGRLAVNVATPQIERGDFPALLEQALAKESMPADCLEIEITESFIMGNAEAARDALLVIQSLGVTTAVDDFGTGYSSLSYLKELPIDNLKIDRAFVKDLPGSSRDVAITRAIIAMAHSLGFKVTAEGIEDSAQQAWLWAEGCDEAQGYFIAKPMPAAEFGAWLRAFVAQRASS